VFLAIDTSTSVASLALATEQATLAELDWEVGRRHSTELLQRLEWLLATTNTPLDALTGIAVATGPGSFNGLRVALTTAKSLALARDLPLYGAPTLDVAAWGYAYVQGPLWAILEAGRGQVYAARYPAPATSAVGWGPLDGYAARTPEELAERVQAEPGGADSAFFCGEWREQTREALQARLGERARFASPLRLRRGGWLAELALAQLTQGLRIAPATLEPLYLRRPAITTSSKRGIAPVAGGPKSGDAPHESSDRAASEREETSHALHH
jgi:tRNA threonylcarbamoyladenosine biosynthesis protein TsaB